MVFDKMKMCSSGEVAPPVSVNNMKSRREFVVGASAAIGAVAAFRPTLSWGADEVPAIAGKHGMTVRSLRFLDLEMPVEYANCATLRGRACLARACRSLRRWSTSLSATRIGGEVE